jgi:hypothetical protein
MDRFRIEYIEAARMWITVLMGHILGKIKLKTTKDRDGPRYIHNRILKFEVRRDADLEAQGAGRVPSVAGSVLERTK